LRPLSPATPGSHYDPLKTLTDLKKDHKKL
jgi:hypothetical protein